MTWRAPEDAPCKSATNLAMFDATALRAERILATRMQFCQFCSDQQGCLEEGVRTESWGVWGGVGLSAGVPTKQPSMAMIKKYRERKNQ